MTDRQANIGLATTGELLEELRARNNVWQRPKFRIPREQTDELIEKLRRAFTNRPYGLDYKALTEEEYVKVDPT